jgi:hypothetical protein
MSGTVHDSQAKWIERVIGLKVSPAGSGDGKPRAQPFEATWSLAVQDFQNAIETVDGQISSLQKVLKTSDFPFLHRIADAGMNGITGNHKVPVFTAIREVGAAAAGGRETAAAKARSAIDAFVTHLDTDPRVQACDRNPFGISVAIKKTLVPALTDLRTALGIAA